MAELTERQWQVYEGIKDEQSVGEIAEAMGVTPSYVTQLRGELRDLGVIRLRGELPAHGRYTELYPWELVSDQPPTYKPALPPKAVFRVEYMQTSQRDLTVPPIRHVWWGRWSVQGIPMGRPDGKQAREALPEHRVVVITDLENPDRHLSYVVKARNPFHQRLTEAMLETVVTQEDMETMTLVIAAAVGVDAVLDVSTE